MLKMDVTNSKLEHAKAQIKCQVSTRRLACHQKEFQRAKNLLVSLQILIIWPSSDVLHVSNQHLAK